MGLEIQGIIIYLVIMQNHSVSYVIPEVLSRVAIEGIGITQGDGSQTDGMMIHTIRRGTLILIPPGSQIY